MGKKFYITQFLCFFFKNLYKTVADPFAFLLRIGNPVKFFQKIVFGSHMDDLQICLFPKKPQNAFRFTGPHKTIIDIDACQLAANGPMHQRSGDGRIHASA